MSGHSRRLALVGGAAAVMGSLWVVVVLAPPWFIPGSSLERLEAQNDVRATLLQGLAGLVLLVGAYLTTRQLQTTREGQITERYTRAIDQLGHAQLDVRVGGIYALERIARDSPADRATIGEVLSSFVRSHSPWPPSLPGQFVASVPAHMMPDLQVRAPDVQAGVRVLGRGDFASTGVLDLSHTDLRRAEMRRAAMGGANLREAHLEWSDLSGAHLRGADLASAHLQGANLSGADLEGADLAMARLEQANLDGATLTKANLTVARLERVSLDGAYLTRASFETTHLMKANLTRIGARSAAATA